jgi:3-dehydroquinate synthetase
VVGSGGLQDLDSHLQRAGLSGPFLVVSQPRIFKAVGTSLRKRFPIELIPEGERAKSLGTITRILQRFARYENDKAVHCRRSWWRRRGRRHGFRRFDVHARHLGRAGSYYAAGTGRFQHRGKTGINFRTIKNLVGAFHQPRLVLTDIDTLTTLPAREYRSGLYEALKYGIICDRDLFDWFGVELKHILDRSPEHMERLVARCAAIKADVRHA